jgi:hypothetical protein
MTCTCLPKYPSGTKWWIGKESKNFSFKIFCLTYCFQFRTCIPHFAFITGETRFAIGFHFTFRNSRRFLMNGFSPLCSSPCCAHTVREPLWRHRTSMTCDSGRVKPHKRYTMRGDQVAFDEMCRTVCDMHGIWNTRYLQLLVIKGSSVKPRNFGCDTVSQFKGRWRGEFWTPHDQE